MNTNEHTELGDALRFQGWDTFQGNPYINIDEKGTLHLNLQGINDKGLPEPIDLKARAGVIIAMSGDYFGGREVSFDLPSITEFKMNPTAYSAGTCETLGKYLIKKPITTTEEQKLISSYKRLANANVHQSDIDTIYTINNGNYIPFSNTLNFYVQQLMFALRVKNYSDILNRNLSHFTPWSVRAYSIGHQIALKYARLHHELKQLMDNSDYQSDNKEFHRIRSILGRIPKGLSPDNVKDLAHRYQALSLGMEFFSFHYYTDHFAAGHISFVGDLRALLPKRFGVLGSILVNNLHDELNRVTVYTKRIYSPTPNTIEPPVEASGDNDFDIANNYFNKHACLAGMTRSLQDLQNVFKGGKIPEQSQYGGLEQMPDIDDTYRQPQPLLLLGKDNQIYYRTNLNQIDTLSPSQLQATYSAPSQHGYTELSSKFRALLLVFKLRALPFTSQLKTLTAEQLKLLEAEESQLNPERKPIPQPPNTLGKKPVTIPAWQQPAKGSIVLQGLVKNSLLSISGKVEGQLEKELTLGSETSFSPTTL